jgi:hypothetical protein
MMWLASSKSPIRNGFQLGPDKVANALTGPALPFVRRKLWRIAASAAALVVSRSSWAQSPRAVRIRATIDAADASGINLTTRSGQQLTVALSSDTVILAIVPFRLDDIKPGLYVGAAAMPQPDGTQRALEVHVFPENMRGTGEGHSPFDLQPRSTMTNGTVTGNSGRDLTVKYPDGQKTIVVPADTPVVTYEPGSPSLLVPGSRVIVVGTEAADGKLSASLILVGKDGLVPPM